GQLPPPRQRPPPRFPFARTPEPDGGIHHIADLNQCGQLSETHPRIGRPLSQYRDLLSQKINLLQAVDGRHMQVLTGRKVRHDRTKPQSERQHQKPAASRPKIKMNESQAGPDPNPVKKVSPAKRCSEYLR